MRSIVLFRLLPAILLSLASLISMAQVRTKVFKDEIPENLRPTNIPILKDVNLTAPSEFMDLIQQPEKAKSVVRLGNGGSWRKKSCTCH